MSSMSPERSIQITPRQHQILAAISASQQSRGCSPTIAELARKLDLSRSTVFGHISELRAKGLIEISPGKARSSRLTCLGQERLEQLQPHASDLEDESTGESTIPLLGRVAAGLPIDAIEEKQDLSLHGMFGTDQSLFSLQVQGDSMIEEDIHNGDYVICRRTSVARNGDLVVAIVDDDETTLKRFYREADRVRLQPANAQYQPIYSNHCRIEAVVVGLLRQL